MTVSKHNSESRLKHYVSKAQERNETRKDPCHIRTYNTTGSSGILLKI